MHAAPRGDLEGGPSDISIERLSQGVGKRRAPKSGETADTQQKNSRIFIRHCSQGASASGLRTVIDYLSGRTCSKAIQARPALGVGPEVEDTGLIHSFFPHFVTEHLPCIRRHDRSREAPQR